MRRYAWLCVLLLLGIAGCRPRSTDATEEGRVDARADALTLINVPDQNQWLGIFGAPKTPTLGQVITAPATDRRLVSFSFEMEVPTSVIFRAHVYSWDGSRATGASLWDGPPQSTTNSGFQLVKFSPNVTLTANAQYVVFVSTSEDVSVGWGFLGYNAANPYAGGDLVYLNNTSAAEFTTTNWTIAPWDLVIGATFDQPVATTTTVVSSVNPTVFRQSTTFTATVAAASGTPRGTVTFFDGTTALGTGTVNGAGQASLATNALAVGSHTITAQYGDGGAFAGSTSSALSQTVNQAGTTTTLISSANPSVTQQNVTFTATVKAASPGAGTPSGSVSFKEGTTVLGTGTLNASGVATFTTSALSIGTHGVSAVYDGSTNYKPSTSSTVSQRVNLNGATVSLASTPNPSTYLDNVTFTATVSSAGPGGTPGGTVTFREGLNTLGTSTLNASAVATFSTSGLVGGSHTISADYSGDGAHAAATGTFTHLVERAPSTTSLASLTNPSISGQSVTLTATVAGAGVVPTGTVTITDGAMMQTASLNGAGQAIFDVSALSVGTHAIVASYDSDTNYAASTSDTLSQEVGRAGTAMVLASSSNPSLVGESITFTAALTVVAPGSGVPVGAVSFQSSGMELGSGVLDGSGRATFTTSALASGTTTVTAVYLGDDRFVGSSDSVMQVVNQEGTSVSVTAAPNPSSFGDLVTFTAIVASSGPGEAPSGTVTFKEGASTLGTALLSGGAATFATAMLSAGPHTIDVTYAGDGKHAAGSASVSVTVNAVTTSTTLVASANPSYFGQSVTFTATVVPAPSTGTVAFVNGATTLGTSTLGIGGTATFTTTDLTVATHPITAVYSGDSNYVTSTSNALAMTVNKAGTDTLLSSSSSPSVVGASITITANVKAALPGAGTPGGTVTFKEGTTLLGTAMLDGGGIATFSTASLPAGAHSITAEYGGDGNFETSTSTFDQHVSPYAATIVVTTSPNPSTFGQEITVKAVLSGDRGTPSGTVTFKDGSTTIGAGALTASGETGEISVKTAALTVGIHSLVAEYGGDAAYGTGSGSAAHTVGKATTTTILESSAPAATFGERVTFMATVTSPIAGLAGDVEFFDGTVSLGKAPLQSGKATFASTALAVGAHAMTARYLGNASFGESTSKALAETIAPKAAGQDAGVDGGTSDAGANEPSTESAAPADTGCGCRTVPSSSGTLTVAPLAALALLVACGRRRHRHQHASTSVTCRKHNGRRWRSSRP